MKIRSMACLMKNKPVRFKERVLSIRVLRDRFINGHVIQQDAGNQPEKMSKD
jgi:hypothetical protein